MKSHSSVRHQLLIEMVRYQSFRRAVEKEENPNTEWVVEFWKRKKESLKPIASDSVMRDALINEFGRGVYNAVKDVYEIAKYYSDICDYHLRKKEKGSDE